MQKKDEGTYIDLICTDINFNNYPKGNFESVPYDMNRLIGYIEDNALWTNKFTEDILEDIRDRFIQEYHFEKKPNSTVYRFNEDLMLSGNAPVPTVDELRKKKSHFDILYEKWDCLLFGSTRAKTCKTYDETTAKEQRKEEIKLLTDYFVGIPESFTWLDGKIREIPDPRTYYNPSTQKYDYEALKSDLRKVVTNLNATLVSGSMEKATKLESIQQAWLSRYAEYMYNKGYGEIPEATTVQKDEIRQKFYALWGNSYNTDYHIKWYTLKQERIEEERQNLLERLKAEEEVRKYLEERKDDAVLLMISGGVGVVSGVAIMILCPPSAIAAAIGVADVGFSLSSFIEGYNQYSAIQNKVFDKTKEYNIVKGILVDIGADGIAMFYDFVEAGISVASGVGNIDNILKLTTLNGNELQTIFRAVNTGASTVTVRGMVLNIKNEK